MIESGRKFSQLEIGLGDSVFSAAFILFFFGTAVNPNDTISIFGRLAFVCFVNDGF